MNALTSWVNVLGLNGHGSPCRFTYLCVKEPNVGIWQTARCGTTFL
jgi:hypothetical protein